MNRGVTGGGGRSGHGGIFPHQGRKNCSYYVRYGIWLRKKGNKDKG